MVRSIIESRSNETGREKERKKGEKTERDLKIKSDPVSG